MGLAYSVNTDGRVSLGNRIMVEGTIDFDSSYPTGGEVFDFAQLGLGRLDSIDFDDNSGYGFQFDYTNQKVKVFDVSGGTLTGTITASSAGTPAGTVTAPTFTGSAMAVHSHSLQVIQDEVLSVTAGTGVSQAAGSFPIGSVDNVFITAGGVTGVAELVPVGSVASSKQVSVNYTTGVFQFLVADAVTAIKVTYVKAPTTTNTAGTPSGTNSVPTFTGLAMSTHNHAATLSGAAALAEVTNATDLSALTLVRFRAFGY